MKLIKVDKNISPQEYTYQCTSCGDIRIHKQDKNAKTDYCQPCGFKNKHPKEGTSKYGITPYAEDYSKQLHKIEREERLKIDRECDTCGKPYRSTSEHDKTTCTTCAKFNRGMTSSNTSGFVGVGYIRPRIKKSGATEQGFWYGRMKFQGKCIFNVEYKDSYVGTDDYKKLKCAVDRDIHIIENGLHHHRNFTDDEIKEYIKNGISEEL